MCSRMTSQWRNQRIATINVSISKHLSLNLSHFVYRGTYLIIHVVISFEMLIGMLFISINVINVNHLVIYQWPCHLNLSLCLINQNVTIVSKMTVTTMSQWVMSQIFDHSTSTDPISTSQQSTVNKWQTWQIWFIMTMQIRWYPFKHETRFSTCWCWCCTVVFVFGL